MYMPILPIYNLCAYFDTYCDDFEVIIVFEYTMFFLVVYVVQTFSRLL